MAWPSPDDKSLYDMPIYEWKSASDEFFTGGNHRRRKALHENVIALESYHMITSHSRITSQSMIKNHSRIKWLHDQRIVRSNHSTSKSSYDQAIGWSTIAMINYRNDPPFETIDYQTTYFLIIQLTSRHYQDIVGTNIIWKPPTNETGERSFP